MEEGQRRLVAQGDVLGFAEKFTRSMGSPTLWAELAATHPSLESTSVAEAFAAAVRRVEQRDGRIDPGIVALQRWILESNLAAPLEEVGVAALLDDSDTEPEDSLLPTDDRFVLDGMDRLIDLRRWTSTST